MICSHSAEYALRALVHMATLPQAEFALARGIAAEAEIPAHFLAKILQDLARAGLLQSSKGPGGGFRLARPAREISLRSVVEAVDGAARLNRCPMGLGECSDRVACGMHDTWKPVQSRIMEYMGASSIADVAKSLVLKIGLQTGPARAQKTLETKLDTKAVEKKTVEKKIAGKTSDEKMTKRRPPQGKRGRRGQ